MTRGRRPLRALTEAMEIAAARQRGERYRPAGPCLRFHHHRKLQGRVRESEAFADFVHVPP